MTQPRQNLTWILTAMGGICLGVAAHALSDQKSTAPASPLPVPVAHEPGELSSAFREVSARVLPSVVSITTEARGESMATGRSLRGMSPQQEEMLKRFFGNSPQFDGMFPGGPQGEQMPAPRRQGTGSGFIVDSSGIILTNSHVVEGADKVIVKFDDGREIQAESWHADPRSDVAIVRVKTNETLPAILLGDSEQMQVGDWVLALGNPFNVGTTVTSGIISATGRGPHINEREEFLQTDAAINPGNSGGPLVNLFGEVIGMNTAISSRSGGYDGIGFAIPSNNLRWVADQLIAQGEVKRSYLGVSLKELTSDLRNQMKVPYGQGALVLDVIPDGPAEKANVQAGDIILAFAGSKITNNDSLVNAVERSSAGQTYDMDVLRNGKQVTLPVRVEAMPTDYTARLRRSRPEEANPAPEKKDVEEFEQLGVNVSDLSSDLANQLGIDSSVKGVVVRNIKGASPAAEAGVQTGDVIQRVGTTTVNNVEEFRAAVEKADLNDGVLLFLKRGKNSDIVVLKSVK